VIDSRQASTHRLNQSTTAARSISNFMGFAYLFQVCSPRGLLISIA
jgi:hypothetical protein